MADRILFNGNDLSSLVMCRMERSILPDIANETVEIPGKHGAILRTSKLASYIQPVTFMLRSTDRRDVADLRHQLAALLYTDEPKPLCLPDDPLKYHLAILDGSTNLGTISDDVPEVTVNFLICDPVAYSTNSSIKTISSGSTVSIITGGNWRSYPTFDFVPTSTSSFQIKNSTTGEFVKVTSASAGSIVSGGTYLIDMEQERVTYNGETVGVTADSDFFSIKDTVSIYASGGSATMHWRQRWL